MAAGSSWVVRGPGSDMGLAKDPWEIALMRESGRRLADVASILREAVKPGVTTGELDEIAEREIRKLGAVPSFKGYTAGGDVPFPATICASVNEEVVHGIPGDRALVDGDIISVDMGLIYGGYHADHAFTSPVGRVSERVKELLDATERSLYEGVLRATAGHRIGDIGHAIQKHVEPKGFGVVREYVGHGIGRRLHEAPSVPNFGRPGKGNLLKLGMCLAIEPMITMGSYKTKLLDDAWTVVTQVGSLAAHFEHTIVITERGPEVLTAPEGAMRAWPAGA